ncbi:YtzH-like family protein [Bacillaceae bacterium S4-13-58]
MPLTHQHQLQVLTDILKEQSEECCATVAEYEQIERIAKELMANADFSQQEAVMQQLENIYSYAQQGKGSPNPNELATAYQQEIENWVQEVDPANFG